jgi:hypothetical protein
MLEFWKFLTEMNSMYERQSKISEQYKQESDGLNSLITKQKYDLTSLHKRVYSLFTSLEYYKRNHDANAGEAIESLPLDEAIIKSVNSLLSSKHHYKHMTSANVAEAVTKAIFNNNFANGVAFDSIISSAKQWIWKNIFTLELILKQMDLHGGTLNYEGITILNKIEAAYYTGDKQQYRDRLLCTWACLKWVAKHLESAESTLCSFHSYMTPFGEAIEFDYAKATHFIIDAFGLSDTGRERAVNVTAFIDAAHLTKNICHTSVRIKMMDPGGFYMDG